MFKFARIPLLACAAAAAVFMAGCNGESPSGGGESGVSYPVEQEITHKDGRKLDVVILGRSESEIFFESKTDGKRYDFPIDDLSLADRVTVKKLPVRSVPKVDPAAKREARRKDSYIKFRETEIARLERKLRDLQEDKREADNRGDSTRAHAYGREIVRVQREISKMKSEIRKANRE